MNAYTLFFYKHAGFSVRPGETQEDGRARCARALADAEAKGREAGLSFDWSIDHDADSRDYAKGPRYEQWQCACLDENGKAVAYLGWIDFGREGSPHSDPYRRVVEAELAMEALP